MSIFEIMELFAQFGIAGISLGIIVIVVKYFINAIQQKDEYIKILVCDSIVNIKELTDKYQREITDISARYQATVNDYIKNGNESRRRHNEILTKLIDKIDKWK